MRRYHGVPFALAAALAVCLATPADAQEASSLTPRLDVSFLPHASSIASSDASGRPLNDAAPSALVNLAPAAAAPVTVALVTQAPFAARGGRVALVPLESARHAALATRPSQGASRDRKVWQILLGSAVGGFAGLYGGGYLGAAIEGDCGGCDDPGLAGFLIGAPIGAAVGAILGGKYLFR